MMAFWKRASKPVATVLVSGMACERTVHASLSDGSGHLYFSKDKKWEPSCENGHWASLVDLLVALREAGHYEVTLETTYIR